MPGLVAGLSGYGRVRIREAERRVARRMRVCMCVPGLCQRVLCSRGGERPWGLGAARGARYPRGARPRVLTHARAHPNLGTPPPRVGNCSPGAPARGGQGGGEKEGFSRPVFPCPRWSGRAGARWRDVKCVTMPPPRPTPTPLALSSALLLSSRRFHHMPAGGQVLSLVSSLVDVTPPFSLLAIRAPNRAVCGLRSLHPPAVLPLGCPLPHALRLGRQEPLPSLAFKSCLP